MKHIFVKAFDFRFKFIVAIVSLLFVSLGVWGYSGCKVSGSWDNWVTEYDISTVNTSFSVSLDGNTQYYFRAKAENNDWLSCGNGCKYTSSSENNLYRNPGVNVPFKTDKAGTYTFTNKCYGNGTVTIYITYPSDCAASAPNVTTIAAEDITTNSATIGASVSNTGTDGNCATATISSAYIQKTTNDDKSGISETEITDKSDIENMSVNITGLTNNTKYYYRAKVVNSASQIGYGDWMSFTAGAPTSPPVARIGKKLTLNSSTGAVRVSGYIAKRGCSNVESVTVYYSNNSSFRDSEDMKTSFSNYTLSTSISELGLIENISLSAEQVAGVVNKGETLYVRITATNAAGHTSAYSDIVSLVYDFNKYARKENVILNATACPGESQFTWSTMFLPMPKTGEYTVTNAACGSEGQDVTSQFTLDGDNMVWNTDGYSTGEYSFCFTANKSGYESPATAELTANLTAATSDARVTITQGGVFKTVSTEPWVENTFTATYNSGSGNILWTCTDGAIFSQSSDGSSASFKATKAGTYTVTARAVTASCGSSEPDIIKVEVSNQKEGCYSSNQ